MSYRVVIPTAGTGSRLGKMTKYLNKSLVSISHRPTICHLIEQFPKDCEFVIALGYKGNLVRDFLELAYPNRIFYFVNVELYEGAGSGLGLSLLSCEKYLQQPFVFLSCDTLVKEKIPKPNYNWMGYAQIKELSKYRTVKIDNNKISEICEKGFIKNNLRPYVGLAGISDFKIFWDAMKNGRSSATDQGESFGMKAILKVSKVYAKKFTWFDTGNEEAIAITRKEYSLPSEPNILEKEKEAIWFIDDYVIKYADDITFIKNRVNRAKELKRFVPEIISYKKNMYCYKMHKGKVLSEVITLPIFEEFLEKCKEFWLLKKLTIAEQNKFQNHCMTFYKDKTFQRINLFYEKFNKKDNVEFINGERVSSLDNLLNNIDWNWISNGIAGRFHGDFHFENILYSKKNESFTFLDWRQDFAGDLFVGDIYYDLAKLMHGIIVNHGIITNNQFSVTWEENRICYDFHRKQILVECEVMLNNWIVENGYDLRKVIVLTGLIYLNISALHHYPYSLLLYGLGKNVLKKGLK